MNVPLEDVALILCNLLILQDKINMLKGLCCRFR